LPVSALVLNVTPTPPKPDRRSGFVVRVLEEAPDKAEDEVDDGAANHADGATRETA
jgi:hypothetical protein